MDFLDLISGFSPTSPVSFGGPSMDASKYIDQNFPTDISGRGPTTDSDLTGMLNTRDAMRPDLPPAPRDGFTGGMNPPQIPTDQGLPGVNPDPMARAPSPPGAMDAFAQMGGAPSASGSMSTARPLGAGPSAADLAAAGGAPGAPNMSTNAFDRLRELIAGGKAGGLMQQQNPLSQMFNSLGAGLSTIKGNTKGGTFARGMGGAMNKSGEDEKYNDAAALKHLKTAMEAQQLGDNSTYKQALTNYYNVLAAQKSQQASAASAGSSAGKAAKPPATPGSEISMKGDGTQGAPYEPATQEDYDNITPGSYYVANGQIRLKK